MNAKITRKDRILKVFEDAGISELTQICPRDDKMYAKLYRQLWSKDESVRAEVSLDVVEYILDKLPDVSSDYIVRGEGPMQRTTIYTPPQNRQDIHLEGGTAAISQSGNATMPATPEKQSTDYSPADIAQMIRDNDLGGLVAIILQQKDEIIRLKEQRIADLEQSVRIADTSLFPPTK